MIYNILSGTTMPFIRQRKIDGISPPKEQDRYLNVTDVLVYSDKIKTP